MIKPARYLTAIIALILTLTLVALAPLNTAAATVGKYISELYIAYGKDEADAEAVLTSNGFMPIKGNLNDNCDAYVMMGYKTTDDIRESITDIAVMNMDGSFNTTEYTEVLRQRKTMYSAYRSLKDKITGDIKSYLFFKLSDLPKTYDEAAGNMTATAMSGDMIAVVGFGGLVLGGAIGSVITALVKRKKKNKD